jgi:hypothetical protein
MTLLQKAEYMTLRAKIEVNIIDFHDEFLIQLLKSDDITDELKAIVCDEIKRRAQVLQDAVIEHEDDLPRCEDIPGIEVTIQDMHNLFKF